MTSNVGEHRRFAGKLLAVVVAVLIVCGLALAPPVIADIDQCRPPGIEGAIASPAKLVTVDHPDEDNHTTADVIPLASVDIGTLRLKTPGTLTVATLSGNPPTACINSSGRFTGLDDELLRAIADKLGLRVNFIGTDFSTLLAQVAARRVDVGSAAITATNARRRTVDFTNGYNFGYFSLVVPAGSTITGFNDLKAGQRIAVVQGTTEDTYCVETLHLQPAKFPDYISAYASLKTHQVDAWMVGTMEAQNAVRPGDPAAIVENAFSMGNDVAYAVANENRALTEALNSGLDAVIADGTWSRLYTEWVPRPLPPGWKPGSKAALTPHLPKFDAIAARHHRPAGEHVLPKSTFDQLQGSFFNWRLYQQAIPVLLTTGVPNTLILTVSASVIGLAFGMILAIAGMSRARWLRWPARAYVDILRGLPEVVTILLIGLSLGPVVSTLTDDNPYPLGIAALGLTAGAYVGEIFRSGIQSIEDEQLEAARALGFSYPTAMRLVVVPQGIRRVLPALVNQFITLLKASALVYFLGLIAGQRELFQVGRDLNAQTGNLSPLVAAGIFYLMLTIPLTHLVNLIDGRLRRGRMAATSDDTLDQLTSTSEVA